LAGEFGRHRNPYLPADRRENNILNPARDDEQDLGKLGKFPPAAGDNGHADDPKGQMEKPMQIAEPRVQQDEDQVMFLCHIVFC